jgi:hypothetical protein
MSSVLYPPRSTREIIQLISAELDARQLAVLARLSPTERLELMFTLCDFLRQLAFDVERQQHPDMSDTEIAARVSQRIQNADG